MLIQSLSVVVPTKGCVNDCPFCVSKLHESKYADPSFADKLFDANDSLGNSMNDRYYKRMNFARDNDCNTLMITGTGEPLQNRSFLYYINSVNKNLEQPFRWIELQTTGVYLTDENLDVLKQIGVSTISLSVADIFDSNNNLSIMNVQSKLRFDLGELCKKIVDEGFNLRLSLNMLGTYEVYKERFRSGEEFSKALIHSCKMKGANQITFRKMYYGQPEGDYNEKVGEVHRWLVENKLSDKILRSLNDYVINRGSALEVLPFGETRYSIDGMSVVIDDDCMNQSAKKDIKYLILRPNGKLYTKWNDEGSLLF